MIRYSQVKDMLEQVRDVHGQLVLYYDRLSKEAEQRRVKMLLDHMSKHEQDLQDGLRAYEETATQGVMDTYVDCKYCDEILVTCKQTPIAPETSVEGVIRVAMDIDNCLLRFFRESAEHAETERVRDVFKNLVDMEESELRKLAMNALLAMDY
jgi:rubrerythrin